MRREPTAQSAVGWVQLPETLEKLVFAVALLAATWPAQLESSWSVTVTVLAARAAAGLVVVPAEGWLPVLAPPPQAVSSNTARPTGVGSAVA